jgi:NAD(P)H-hydrate epimerase
MKQIEEEAVKRGITVEKMMENAGKEVAQFVRKKLGNIEGKKIFVFCGTGNNGGDGLVAARYLAQMGGDVTVFLLGSEESIKTFEARKNWEAFQGKKFVVTEPSQLSFKDEPDVVIDAIFGTGVRGKIREPARTAIQLINRMRCFKVAVDIPSGIDPLTGDVHDVAVRADVTVTLHRPKLGLKNRKEFTGEIYVAPIGI